MTHQSNSLPAPLVKIVYSKVTVNGKLELVPLKLLADGSLRPNQ